jgi:hypothetical protein
VWVALYRDSTVHSVCRTLNFWQLNLIVHQSLGFKGLTNEPTQTHTNTNILYSCFDFACLLKIVTVLRRNIVHSNINFEKPNLFNSPACFGPAGSSSGININVNGNYLSHRAVISYCQLICYTMLTELCSSHAIFSSRTVRIVLKVVSTDLNAQIFHNTMNKIPIKCTSIYLQLVYLHVSALTGHLQGVTDTDYQFKRGSTNKCTT